MGKHNPDLVAHIASGLLAGRIDAEPHHIRAAVATANALLDETHAEHDVAVEPEVAAPKAPEPVKAEPAKAEEAKV